MSDEIIINVSGDGDQIGINVVDDPISSVNGKTGIVVLDKNDIGLSAVDNTSDLDKPLSNVAVSAFNTLNTSVDFLSSVVVGSGTIQSLSFNDVTSELTISSSNTVAISGYVTSQINKLGLSNVNSLSGNWNDAYTNLVTNSAAYLSGVDLSFLSVSGNWNSVYNNVNLLSGDWNSVYNNVNSLSSNWFSASADSIQYAHANFLPLTGGLVSGPVRFNNNITIFGDLSCSGTQTFSNTIFSTTSALSVVHVGSGDALWVGNDGIGHIASFYDIDQNIEILHVGGENSNYPNVGVKTSTPNKTLTVNGEISANNTIYDLVGNSNQWNSVYNNVNATSGLFVSVYNNVNALSSSWEESADIIPTVTNYLSTNNVLLSSIDVTGRVILDDQLYYVADEDGQWLGRTKIKENNIRLNDVSLVWKIGTSVLNASNFAMTSDGRSQVVVGTNIVPIFSDDYGKTFSINAAIQLPLVWTGVAYSSDGKHRTLVASSSPLYVSNDYGATWNVKDTNRLWNDIAMSSDGRFQTAVVNTGLIYISNDFGNTWSPKALNAAWSSVAVSSSGKIQTATIDGGFIYRSVDYGNTWSVVRNTAASYRDIAMSSDGRYQFVAVNNSQILVSRNYGVSWVAVSTTALWTSIAVSSDGKYVTAVAQSSPIFYSRDHGLSWANNTGTLSNAWNCVAMSSDGKYQIAGGNMSVTYRSVADEEIEGDLNIIGSLNYAQPYARFSINGGTGLFAMNNSTEYIIPWNTEDEQYSDIIETQLANDNVIIKKTGTYHVKVRFSCYDMFDASDFLRVRLRQSTTGIIGNASAGTLNTTLGWRFMGGTLLGNGEAYVEGETILRVTSASTTAPFYLAATVLGTGGSGNGNTTFYPYVDNAFGTQSYMEVRKIA